MQVIFWFFHIAGIVAACAEIYEKEQWQDAEGIVHPDGLFYRGRIDFTQLAPFGERNHALLDTQGILVSSSSFLKSK